MFFNLAVVLLILWAVGLFSGYTFGAFVHVLLLIAIVLFFAGIVRRRPTSTKFPAQPKPPTMQPPVIQPPATQ